MRVERIAGPEPGRASAGRLWLCLGRDLRWYPYARSDQDWEPSGSPAPVRPAALQDQ